MKPFVDATKCSGYGTCAEKATTLFQLDDCGYASVIAEARTRNSSSTGLPK